MKELRAAEAGAAEEDGALTVAFGDLGADPPWHILLSRTLEPVQRDGLLGMTGLWMELDDKFHSGYDAVTIETVESGHVSLRVDAKRLNLDEAWSSVRIALPEGDMAGVRSALRRLRDAVPNQDAPADR